MGGQPPARHDEVRAPQFAGVRGQPRDRGHSRAPHVGAPRQLRLRGVCDARGILVVLSQFVLLFSLTIVKQLVIIKQQVLLTYVDNIYKQLLARITTCVYKLFMWRCHKSMFTKRSVYMFMHTLILILTQSLHNCGWLNNVVSINNDLYLNQNDFVFNVL